MFIVEFRCDGTPEITAVTFGSLKLVSGVTTTDQFRMNVSANAKQGGLPIRLVVDNVPLVSRNMGQGTATLGVADGTATLSVVGTNDGRGSFDLKLVCGPRQD